eukprot:scaffold17157_cov53-Attheya_sp.AAC.2
MMLRAAAKIQGRLRMLPNPFFQVLSKNSPVGSKVALSINSSCLPNLINDTRRGFQKSGLPTTTASVNAGLVCLLGAGIFLTTDNYTETSKCEEKKETDFSDTNPLWPSGVSPEMVNRYVDNILANPDINIASIPDSIERIIYVSTVRLTLNAIYEPLSALHGLKILGHHLTLQRKQSDENSGNAEADSSNMFTQDSAKIDFKTLDAMANELLENKSINQKWIPDIMERQVYRNCLYLVFVILDRVADSLAFRFCGHQLSFSFEPLTSERASELAQAATKRNNDPLVIDPAILDAIADEAVAKSSHDCPSSASVMSYFPFYKAFIRELHKTLCEYDCSLFKTLTELVVLEESIQVTLSANTVQIREESQSN